MPKQLSQQPAMGFKKALLCLRPAELTSAWPPVLVLWEKDCMVPVEERREMAEKCVPGMEMKGVTGRMEKCW